MRIVAQAFIVRPSEALWQLVVTPLFATVNASAKCFEAISSAYMSYQYLVRSEEACADSAANPDASALLRAISCLEDGVGPNRSAHVWLRFNETDLNETYSIDSLAYFSSRGPTADGRIKPDIVAPGHAIISSRSDGHPYTFQCDENEGPAGVPLATAQAALTWMSGTSMATPLASGSAALVRQYYREGYFPHGVRNASMGFEPKASLIKATLIHGSSPMAGKSCTHGFDGDCLPLFNLTAKENLVKQGWGRLRLDSVLRPPHSPFSLFRFEAVFAQLNESSGGGAHHVCDDLCSVANDGDCDDGGDGAEYDSCPAGSDCTDCGTRRHTEALCKATCKWADDTVCDDGGVGAEYSSCDLGTDCSDCGTRYLPVLNAPAPPSAPPPMPPVAPTEGWAACILVPPESSSAPFRATLVYTDHPGELMAERALVNDLSLVVQHSDGELAGGVNALPADVLDDLNNVEQLELALGVGGNLTVRVVAERVPHGPQPFSLLVSGPVGTRVLADGASCTDTCPRNCSGHGSCAAHGRCLCDPGYGGLMCASPTLPPPSPPPPTPPPAPPPTPPGLMAIGETISIVAAIRGPADSFSESACVSGLALLTAIPASSIAVQLAGGGALVMATINAPAEAAALAVRVLSNESTAMLEASLGLTLEQAPIVSVAPRVLPSACCCSSDGTSGGEQTTVSGCAGALPTHLGGGSFCFVVAPEQCSIAQLGYPSYAAISPTAGWLPCFPGATPICSASSPPQSPLDTPSSSNANASTNATNATTAPDSSTNAPPPTIPNMAPARQSPPTQPLVISPELLTIGQPGTLTISGGHAAPGTWLMFLPFENDVSCSGAATSAAIGGRLSQTLTLTLTLHATGRFRLCTSSLAVPLLDSDYTLVDQAYLVVVPGMPPSPPMATPTPTIPLPRAPPEMDAVEACNEMLAADRQHEAAQERGWWFLGGLTIGWAVLGGAYMIAVLYRRRRVLSARLLDPTSIGAKPRGAPSATGLPTEVSGGPLSKAALAETEAI